MVYLEISHAHSRQGVLYNMAFYCNTRSCVACKPLKVAYMHMAMLSNKDW